MAAIKSTKNGDVQNQNLSQDQDNNTVESSYEHQEPQIPRNPLGSMDEIAASTDELQYQANQKRNARTEHAKRQQYLKQYTVQAEREFTRKQYEPMRIVTHRGRKEWCVIIRQHSLTDFTYIVISDFDNTDRRYLSVFVRDAQKRGYQVHEVMRDRKLRNGNTALEYFLHFATSVGYGITPSADSILTGSQAPKF